MTTCPDCGGPVSPCRLELPEHGDRPRRLVAGFVCASCGARFEITITKKDQA